MFSAVLLTRGGSLVACLLFCQAFNLLKGSGTGLRRGVMLLSHHCRVQHRKFLGKAWTQWRLTTLAARQRALNQLERSALKVSVLDATLNASLGDDMDYVERADDSSNSPPSKSKMMQPLLKWVLLRKMRLQRAYLHWKAQVIQSILEATLVANDVFINKLTMRHQALAVLNTLCLRLRKHDVGACFRC